MPLAPSRSRRERMRELTLSEIREQADAQIKRGGPGGLSLNGIAKAMGMSGPSMYRYFASRDELLATLVTESYEDLADTLTRAASRASRRAPKQRFYAVAHACREWGLANPHRYRLVFGSSSGSGALAPERIIPPSNRAMNVILNAIADLTPGKQPDPVPDATLSRELTQWAARASHDRPLGSDVLLLGLVAWTRMHGTISLEIEGVFDQVGVDAGRLFDQEIKHLVTQRSGDLDT